VAQQHLEEVTRIERIALEAGTGIQTDYLRAEADLADVRASRAQAENAHVVARAELARARGRLTPEWLRANLETAP
jgi:outer membrane protein TolC